MRVVTKDFDVELKSIDGGYVTICGDEKSLEVVTDSLTLCGTEEGTGVRPAGDNRLVCSEGTVALWLQYEVFHMLSYE